MSTIYMSGGPSHGSIVPMGGAASEAGTVPFWQHIRERFAKARMYKDPLPDILWSARYGLDQALLPQIKERCKQKNIPVDSKMFKDDLVQALLDSRGEIQYIWEAFSLSLDELKAVCRHTYPGLFRDEEGAVAQKELTRRLADNDQKIHDGIKTLSRLARRKSGGITPEDTNAMYRAMCDARERDRYCLLLKGREAHHFKRMVSQPLLVLLDHPRAKEAFQSNEELMAEVQKWVETDMSTGVDRHARPTYAALVSIIRDTRWFREDKLPGVLRADVQAGEDVKLSRTDQRNLPLSRLRTLHSHLTWRHAVYSRVVGDDHGRTKSYKTAASTLEGTIKKRERQVAKMPCPGNDEGSEDGSEAKKQRLEALPFKEAVVPSAQGPARVDAAGPTTPPARPGEKAAKSSPDQAAGPSTAPVTEMDRLRAADKAPVLNAPPPFTAPGSLGPVREGSPSASGAARPVCNGNAAGTSSSHASAAPWAPIAAASTAHIAAPSTAGTAAAFRAAIAAPSTVHASAAATAPLAAAPRALVPVAAPTPPVLIACCSYMGGTGSTSTAINLGYTLAEYGGRACYVDCNPQCHLTSFLGAHTSAGKDSSADGDDVPSGAAQGDGSLSQGKGRGAEPAGGSEPSGLRDGRPKLGIFKLRETRNKNMYPVEVCQQGSFDRKGKPFHVTLRSVLEAAFKGKDTPLDILHFSTKLDERGQPEYTGFNDGLFLLPGDKDLQAVVEPKMQQAKGNMYRSNAKEIREEALMALGGFRKALHDIARAHSIKYMICDFGPISGLMSEVLLASCDYIIPAFQPDFFPASWVHGLLHSVLPSLVEHSENVRRQEVNSLPDAYRFNPSPPHVLPFLMMGFKLDEVESPNPLVQNKDAYILDLVAKAIEAPDVPKEVMALFLPDGSGKMAVPFLPELPGIMRASQMLGRPAVGLSEKMFKNSTPQGLQSLRQLEYVQAAFKDLARLIHSVI
eukprot:jgi/Mesvir1/21687/Mv04107-RA.1